MIYSTSCQNYIFLELQPSILFSKFNKTKLVYSLCNFSIGKGYFIIPVRNPFYKLLVHCAMIVNGIHTHIHTCREKLKAEEWRTRVIEDPFNVPHPHSWEEPYAPLIHTSHPYRGHPDPYTFRENQPQKNISPHETFTTLVSPVPLFDKFNRTY